VILDTMVAVYACFEVPDKSGASRDVIKRTRTLRAPESFRAEFLSAAWQYARRYRIDPSELEALISDGFSIPTTYLDVEPLWRDAMALAMEADHSPYDALFVSAARKHRTKVLTFDRRMIDAFPHYCIHVQDRLV